MQEDIAQSIQARVDLLVVEAEEGSSHTQLLDIAANKDIRISLPQRAFFPLQVSIPPSPGHVGALHLLQQLCHLQASLATEHAKMPSMLAVEG